MGLGGEKLISYWLLISWLAIQRLDIPIIMGVTLVAAVGIVVGNLLADIVTSIVDPRVRRL